MSSALTTEFSHVRPQDTPYRDNGLRDFFLYRDLGIAQATHGKVIAQLVKANVPPEQGTGWHRRVATLEHGPFGTTAAIIERQSPYARG